MHWHDVWHAPGVGPRTLRAALAPLSWLYGGGWRLYRALYDYGIKRPTEPHRPVICVGNLTVGGTGKTPIVAYLAHQLPQVIISCSGYGSPKAEAATLAPEGELDAAEWGDEAALLRDLCPGVPLIVGRRRTLAAEIAHKEAPSAVLIMDDGFQHLPLRHHLSLLVRPSPDTNRRCLPAGPYREPPAFYDRATWVVGRGPADRAFRVVDEFGGLTLDDGKPTDWNSLGAFDALCAIGQPTRFFRSLHDVGLHPEREVALPDHAPLSARYLRNLGLGKRPLVVTAKDWVKLRRERADLPGPVLVAHQRVRIEPEEIFRQSLFDHLHEVQAQAN